MKRYLTMGLLALLCASALGAGVLASVAAGGGPDHKTVICHVPPGNPGNAHTIEVDDNALKAHLGDNPEGLHGGDSYGPCPGDPTTTTPTTTTPTTTTPTTTTPTTPTETTPTETTPTETTPTQPPPHVVSGSADVYCDLPSQTYYTTGKIDGQAADSVTPSSIPGGYRGWTNVTVRRGDTDFRTAVFTYGDCVRPGTTTTSTATTAGTSSTTTTVANPPAANSPQPTTPTTGAAGVTPTPKTTGTLKKDSCKEKQNGLLECKTSTGQTVTAVPGSG